jgi:short-subunit dehydrogenase
MIPSRYRDSAALVTGASSGIGEAFARSLAAGGAGLLLTALPDEREPLERIAAELAAAHRIRAEVVPMDLSTPDGPMSLVEAADALGFEPRVLVNSAGFGLGGPFVEASLERQLAMLRVNVLALVALTGAYLPRMIERGDGVVVNIASTAAFQPMPYFATYSASKAFVLSFGEALWAEARGAGVRTVTVCSGPVSTPFHERAGDTSAATGVKRQIKRRYLAAESVVDAAFAAIEADRPRVVLRLPGGRALYAATSALTFFLPRRVEMLAIERFSRWLFPAA